MKVYDVYDIINEVMTRGEESVPRGKIIKELHYFQGIISSPWSSYPARKYPLDYFKREMQWYLGANPYDDRICKHAKMWSKIQQRDGSILSNYGYYWFNSEYMDGMTGFDWVVWSLLNDRDTRQAYIPMNNFKHAYQGNPDFVCTKGIQFRIVDDKLNCHVAMRSSDAIYGLATDLPCFHTLWAMVAVTVGVELGEFVFSADSLHIYDTHFKMAYSIIGEGKEAYKRVDAPAIESAWDLINGTFETDFGKWLTEVEL